MPQKFITVENLCRTCAMSAGIVRDITSCTRTRITVDHVETFVIKSTRKRGTVVNVYNNVIVAKVIVIHHVTRHIGD